MANASIYQLLQSGAGPSTADLIAQRRQQARDAELSGLQLEGARRQNALAALAAWQQQDDRNKLTQIASGWNAQTTPDQRISSLRNSGSLSLMQQADALEKQDLDRRKTGADIGKTNAEVLAKSLDALKFLSTGVMAIPTPQNASLALDAFERLTGHKLDEDRKVLAALQTPEQIKQWAAGHALEADKLLPKLQGFSAGGFYVNQAVDPLTAKPTETGRTAITQSADNAATQATARRGQDMADRRAREANDLTREANANVYDPERGVLVNKVTGLARAAATMDGKPLGAKDKPMTDSQAKAYAFGTRMSAANDIIAKLEQDGATTTIPGMGAGGVVGRAVTALAPEKQQQLEQAKRDWINANLRRESGAVIGQSEFDSADRQYFAQPGDKPEVIRQKTENRRRAEQGVMVEVPDGKRPSAAPGTSASDAVPDDIAALLNKHGKKPGGK
jgi:hypothetical protein